MKLGYLLLRLAQRRCLNTGASYSEALPNELVVFAMQFVSGVAAGVFANWIYEKLKNKAQKLWIDGKPVELEKQAIAASIDAAIKATEDGKTESRRGPLF
jgi:hypothetical protein